MERLTRKSTITGKWMAAYGPQKITDHLAAYEDTGLTPEQIVELKEASKSCEDCDIARRDFVHSQDPQYAKFALLLEAEQEGRIVVLPCKVGDTVYRLDGIYSWDIEHIKIYGDEIIFVDDSDNIFRLDDIGKTVFLTRETAEKAIAEVGE